jgi:hypothetical protein
MRHVAEKPWSVEEFVALFSPVGTAYLEGGSKPVLGTFLVADLTELLPLAWIIERLEVDKKDMIGELNELDVSMKNRKRAANRAIKAAWERANLG